MCDMTLSHEWVVVHMWINHVTQTSCDIHTPNKRAAAQMTSARTNGSSHTHEWVVSHIWRSHVTHTHSLTHAANERAAAQITSARAALGALPSHNVVSKRNDTNNDHDNRDHVSLSANQTPSRAPSVGGGGGGRDRRQSVSERVQTQADGSQDVFVWGVFVWGVFVSVFG